LIAGPSAIRGASTATGLDGWVLWGLIGPEPEVSLPYGLYEVLIQFLSGPRFKRGFVVYELGIAGAEHIVAFPDAPVPDVLLSAATTTDLVAKSYTGVLYVTAKGKRRLEVIQDKKLPKPDASRLCLLVATSLDSGDYKAAHANALHLVSACRALLSSSGSGRQ
jgi:hypothetical protein